MTRWVVLAVVLAALTGCAGTRAPIEQRSTQGPTAEHFWTASVFLQNGREPSFAEKRHWEDEIDARIAAYLRAHPEAANSLNVSTFKFHRQVAVGMDKEQVKILLGEPERTSTDPAEMQSVARRFWPNIRGKATEVLVYPLGWAMFFDGSRLVDITQYLSGR